MRRDASAAERLLSASLHNPATAAMCILLGTRDTNMQRVKWLLTRKFIGLFGKESDDGGASQYLNGERCLTKLPQHL